MKVYYIETARVETTYEHDIDLDDLKDWAKDNDYDEIDEDVVKEYITLKVGDAFEILDRYESGWDYIDSFIDNMEDITEALNSYE